MGLVLLHGFLGRFEDSHCSAMVAFLLELGRILGEGRKDFHRFEGELARSLCASHMVSGEDVLQVGRLEECFKLGVWRSASRGVWSGEVVLPGWLEKALEKTYYKMGVWRRREDVLSWGDVKTYFQLGVWSGKSFLERGGWSKSLGHGASRSSRRLVRHRHNVSFLAEWLLARLYVRARMHFGIYFSRCFLVGRLAVAREPHTVHTGNCLRGSFAVGTLSMVFYPPLLWRAFSLNLGCFGPVDIPTFDLPYPSRRT